MTQSGALMVDTHASGVWQQPGVLGAEVLEQYDELHSEVAVPLLVRLPLLA